MDHPTRPIQPIRIIPGRVSDLLSLAPFHYRAGLPATRTCILAARVEGGAVPAGVLVASMPTLNGPWRVRAWPGVVPEAPSLRARWLNAHVRCISRIIIHPAFRGLGIGRGLVGAYLAEHRTPRTECIAAIGSYAGFLGGAGMRPVRREPGRHEARLARALAAHGVEPWRLADLDRSRTLLRRRPALARAILRWANDSRATRRLVARAEVHEIGALGAARLATPGVVFVWP